MLFQHKTSLASDLVAWTAPLAKPSRISGVPFPQTSSLPSLVGCRSAARNLARIQVGDRMTPPWVSSGRSMAHHHPRPPSFDWLWQCRQRSDYFPPVYPAGSLGQIYLVPLIPDAPAPITPTNQSVSSGFNTTAMGPPPTPFSPTNSPPQAVFSSPPPAAASSPPPAYSGSFPPPDATSSPPPAYTAISPSLAASSSPPPAASSSPPPAYTATSPPPAASSSPPPAASSSPPPAASSSPPPAYVANTPPTATAGDINAAGKIVMGLTSGRTS